MRRRLLEIWEHSAVQVFAKTVMTFGALYGGAILENQVQVVSKGSLWPASWGHALLVLVGIGLMVAVVHHIQQSRANRRLVLEAAHDRIDRWASRRCGEVVAACDAALESGQVQSIYKALVASEVHLASLVNCVFELFDSEYAKLPGSSRRTSFEVTFMTRSYKDDKLTIAAWANSANTTPRSLALRQTDPEIYDRTIAADVLFRASVPNTRIVEDTEQAEGYQALYPGQKKRIRSSVIKPVRSPDSRALGALVVHCDQPRFFKDADIERWDELLEMFAHRLAFEKLKLDHLVDREISQKLSTNPAIASLIDEPF